jgi:hypothetical protein
VGTDPDTGQTTDTASRIPQKLWLRPLGFWIGTPAAPEWTALKKHHGPDARTIMDAKFLNIENNPLLHGSSPYIF